jgi:hypothetical protein
MLEEYDQTKQKQEEGSEPLKEEPVKKDSSPSTEKNRDE